MILDFFLRGSSIKDYSSLKLDLHSHILPGIDDGSPNLDKSAVLLQSLYELGFERCILTPHISTNYYPNTPDTIFAAFDKLNAYKTAVPDHYIQSVAAEYLLDEDFPAKIEGGTLLTLPGKRVLFELPFSQPPMNVEQVVFSMTTRGYIPILAHPERYRYWHGSSSKLLPRMVELGCELQVNILSLLGHYGSSVRAAGFEIIDRFEVAYLATDCHNAHHVDALRKGLKNRELARVLTKERFKNQELLE